MIHIIGYLSHPNRFINANFMQIPAVFDSNDSRGSAQRPMLLLLLLLLLLLPDDLRSVWL